MSNIEYQVSLKSTRHLARRAPPAPLSVVLRVLPDLVRRATLLAFESRSQLKGRTPSWLERASDVRFTRVTGDDDTVLHFEAPRLGDAAEVLYRQQEFWDTRPCATDTGFDLLGDIISDVSSENVDSNRFDGSFLKRLGGLGKGLNGDYQAIQLRGNRFSELPAIVDEKTLESAKQLAGSTPRPNRVRVVGTLDMIRASTQTFAIKLDEGQEVNGVVTNGTVHDLPDFWQERVLVLGTAIYKASGSLLRIDADEVSMASDETSIWSRPPRPSVSKLDAVDLRQPQGPRSGLAAIVGKWPGDETDDEIDEALRELS